FYQIITQPIRWPLEGTSAVVVQRLALSYTSHESFIDADIPDKPGTKREVAAIGRPDWILIRRPECKTRVGMSGNSMQPNVGLAGRLVDTIIGNGASVGRNRCPSHFARRPHRSEWLSVPVEPSQLCFLLSRNINDQACFRCREGIH